MTGVTGLISGLQRELGELRAAVRVTAQLLGVPPGACPHETLERIRAAVLRGRTR